MVEGHEGFGGIYSSLLRATAEALDTLTNDQLRPVEVALTEFLVAFLADRDSRALEAGRNRGKAQLHRICQAIEALLGEPDLTLVQVAEESGVSPRYLQKLFAAEGLNFTAYVRLRRLERCKLELASPIYAALSISQISFNWGFNGSSHFSRAFRAQYGQSPAPSANRPVRPEPPSCRSRPCLYPPCPASPILRRAWPPEHCAPPM
jgi:AraC-like DNA-binding protein